MNGKHFSRELIRASLVGWMLVTLAAAHADDEKPAPVMSQTWIRWGNGLRTEFLVFNALLTNPDANNALTKYPLNKDSFDQVDELRKALHDPAARVFMKYLVSCSLKAGQEVSWTSEDGKGPAFVWHGGGGLCPQWNDAAPTTECLEQVSACILALNNPKGLRVRVSLRCDSADCAETLHPMALVTPDTFIPSQVKNSRPRPAEPISSFVPCPPNSTEECGWYPMVVGTCKPGNPIRFTAFAWQTVKGSLRVCQGPQGCNKTSTQRLAEQSFPSTNQVEVDFTCPDKGSFGVMSWQSSTAEQGQEDDSWKQVKLEGVDTAFPSEADSFHVPEGAFYGNLFGVNAILPELKVWFDTDSGETRLHLPGSEDVYVREDDGWCRKSGTACVTALPVVKGVHSIYNEAYVCAAPDWDGEEEDLPGRICALPEGQGNCAAHLMGPCLEPSPKGASCTVSQDGTFLSCEGGSGKHSWTVPVTTFMSSP